MRPSTAVRRQRPWGWISLGAAGSVLITLAGPLLAGGGPTQWWFELRIPPGHTGNWIALYVGMVALSLAWLGLGRVEQTNVLLRAAALWCLPLLLGAPLFSKDVYSYLAQGTIVHLGFDPYSHPPAILGHLGHQHVLNAVGPFWRNTTAPYGPLFLGLVSVIVSMTGAHLVAGAVVIRLLDVVGIVLLALFVPRLASAAGANRSRALWLAVFSPLVLLELVAAGHNDALMAGLMVAGMTFAMRQRWLLAVGLCALAATIKLPAAAAIVFIALAWARTAPDWRDRARRVAAAVAVAAVIGVVISVVTGLGAGWISSAVFSTPEKVRLAITPATALGWTVASLLHDIGVGVSTRGLESTFSTVAFALTCVFGVVLAVRVRRENMVRYLGALLLAVALFGPAAWPWYLAWGFVLLAADPVVQHWRALPLVSVVAVFLVKPSGILALPIGSSPAVLAVYVLAAGIAWYAWSRRNTAAQAVERGGGVAGRASVLAKS